MADILRFRRVTRKPVAAELIEPARDRFQPARIRSQFYRLGMSVERIAEREHMTRLAVQDVVRRTMWPGVAA